MTEFEQFYEWFQGALERVKSDGPVFSNGHPVDETTSWDRRAAYILFLAVKGEPPP